MKAKFVKNMIKLSTGLLFANLITACGQNEQQSSTETQVAPEQKAQVEVAKKPNIIHLMLDEWGYFESSFMHHPKLETPNIDKFAREGMVFSQFLAGNNVCASTRSSLMTGQHAGHTPIRSNEKGNILKDSDVTIAEVLKKAGYVTGGYGKWGLGDRGTTGIPEKQGFDEFYGYYNQVHAHSYYPEYLVHNSEIVPLKGNTGYPLDGETFSHYLIHDKAMEFLRKNAEKPFYAYLAYTPPHGYWDMPDDDPAWQKFKDLDWGGKNQFGEKNAQLYAAMVEMMDRQLGEIMAFLKEQGLDENTIVILSGDNGGEAYFRDKEHPHGVLAPNLNPVTGERFRGGKRQFYEGGLRIPFIVRWPGKVAPETQSDFLGYFPDVMPTLADIAGLEKPETTDGVSILPTLLGQPEQQQQHEYLYWEDHKAKAVRIGHWKAVAKHGEPFELYNLKTDIEEQNNVAADYPKIVARMEAIAKEAHKPIEVGQVLDESLAFKPVKWKKP
ncbi:arylsulfatase [Gayadomonas joobiniege]|uniref:arylsulfatase n=1 Tax=Gayadomonas joobiniege TaxID=1234606 RepID=UPI00037CE13B|nr:arylsulfatase [Gayadomonas joobiniege]